MAQISVNNLTFCYEGSFDPVFEKVSFSFDTNWRLGLVGRNGKGKTTFLHLLLGRYEYTGSISANIAFDYFPYSLPEGCDRQMASEFLEDMKSGCESWKVIRELDQLGVNAEKLYQPFGTLSFGERTKIMLAVLFSEEHDFLLIDEPTNHLDQESREVVKNYLAAKQGFLLVSHDRDLLDACIDHILVLNRHSIQLQTGNFSSWWENKNRQDVFARSENEKHQKEILKLQMASERMEQWARKSENSKIGFDPVKEHDRCIATRSYIGAKTKKQQRRVKQVEARIAREIEEKKDLLQDIENPVDLKIMPMKYHKETLLSVREYGLQYLDADCPLFRSLTFDVKQGDRIILNGVNGCGKSSLIRVILQKIADKDSDLKAINLWEQGVLQLSSGLVISYINQDTSFLQGDLKTYSKMQGLEEHLFFALLRKLDMDRVQFEKNLETFSEGQKKKVLVAASLLKPAHLYLWDEPLNYINVFSRMQIEKLILAYRPTMLLVEHDVRFREEIATGIITVGMDE